MERKFGIFLLIAIVIASFVFSPFFASAEDGEKLVVQDEQLTFTGEDTKEQIPENGTTFRAFTTEETEKIELTKENFVFQAEVSRLMKLIINSLYKTQEIFLRELISNASDAIDKIRFLALTDPNALKAATDLNITISADKENRLLIITDTGIGMTKEQLRDNLGTIAKSGTSEFLQALEEKEADMNLIGQFGVGFYSVFLVADKVVVTTKSNQDKQYIWESHAVDDFAIAEDPRGNTLGRGTQIVLHIKEDTLEFLEEDTLHNLIKKYSEFINFPIYLLSKKEKVVDVEEEKKTKEESDSDEVKIEDVTEDEEKKTEIITTREWTLMNNQKPIWARDPKDVSEVEYQEFYYSLAKDVEGKPPLAWTHFKAEGEVDFRSIVYVPPKASQDLFTRVDDVVRNIKLFVKRVFITDEFIDFLPKYLQFIRAIVDADDLPLNVSRETLQQHKTLTLIKNHIIKKTLEMINNLSRDEEKYETFLKEFAANLKIGAIEDDKNRKKISKLLRFKSSYKDRNLTSLDDYITRMKKGQDHIYFVAGSSVDEIERTPFLERPLARGYEVLYLTESLDEMLIQRMPSYDGKSFQNLAKNGKIKIDEETEETIEEEKQLQDKFVKLQDWMQATLFDFVEKVQVSKRFTTSPCAVIAQDWGLTGNMERIMAGQTFKNENDVVAQFLAKQKKILEINPNHPLILALLDKANADDFDEKTKETVQILYDTASIRSGYELKDSLSFATRVERLLRTIMGVDLDTQVEVDEQPAPELDEEEKQKTAERLANQEEKDLFEEQDEKSRDEL